MSHLMIDARRDPVVESPLRGANARDYPRLDRHGTAALFLLPHKRGLSPLHVRGRTRLHAVAADRRWRIKEPPRSPPELTSNEFLTES